MNGRVLLSTLAVGCLLSASISGETPMEMNDLFEQIDENRSEHLSFLKQLIKTSQQGEEAVQALVARRFKELGCEVETLRLIPTALSLKNEFAAEEAIDLKERISVIGKFAGSSQGRSLLFFAHPDGEPVTPAELERWTHEPFAGQVEGDRIYGWGVADDLAGVAIMAEALDAVLEAGFRPGGDVLLGSTPAKKNARGILALLNQGYQADAAVYLHPAESEAGLNDVKAIASGMLQFRVKVLGRPPVTKEPGQTAFAHLAVNAVGKMELVVQALKELDEERSERVHHQAIADAVGRSTNLLISHLGCGDAGRLTRVPTECVISASLTFPPNEKLQQVQKEVEECVTKVSQSDPWLGEHPPSIDWLFGTQGVEVPGGHPLYQAVRSAVVAVTGNEPEVNPLHSASDIRNPILFRGIPSVGLGPLAGDFTQAGNHDEWVDVNDYINTIKICADIIMKWCQ